MLFPRGFLLSMGSEAGRQGSRNLFKQKFWAWGAVSTCLCSREPMNCWISPTLTRQYVWNVKMIFDVLWTQLNGFNVDLRESLVSCSLSPSSKSTRGRVDSKPNYRVRCRLIPASVLFLFSAVTSDREKNKRQSPCYENPRYSGYCTTFSSFCEQETWSSFRTTANRNMFLELCCCQTFK